MGKHIFAPYLKERKVKFGNFKIQAFDLPHNGTKNYGFLITVDGQRILYLTDFEYCRYTFKNIDHIICECNYQQELVSRDLDNYEHKIRGHCSLDTCKNFIKANATDSLKTVLLCHLGGETAIPEECVNEIKKVAKNANVDYARAGLEIELRTDECPF